MKRSVGISLERIKVDHLDLLHLHGPQISDITDDVFIFLEDLKRQGIVRAVGVNSFDTDVLEYICKNRLFDFVMLDYNIMRQDREDLIKRLYLNGIGVIAGAALAQSLYSNRVFRIHQKKDIWYLLRALKNFRGHMFEGRNYRFINKVDGITGNQIALKYVLDNPYITSAVFGTTSIDHLIENVNSCKIEIPKSVKQKIVSVKQKSHLDRI